MRNRSWRQYNKSLVQRGSLTFLIDPKLIKSPEIPLKRKRMGKPTEFSDQMILILIMVKIHYRLPYRMFEGFAKEILSSC